MKQKLSAFLLALFFLFTSYGFKVSANETVLLPAVIETINGERWGYIDEGGAFKINPQYSFAGEFNNKGIAIAANVNKDHSTYNVCFIDMTGKIISGPFSSQIPEFKNGVAVLNTDNGSIAVGEDGRILFKSSYCLDEYNDGMIGFLDSKSGLYGFLDLTGKAVIPAKYVSVQAFENGNAIVEASEEKYSVIDRSGKVLKILKAYNKYNSSEGMTAYYDQQLQAYGYKQLDGTIVIKPSFSTAAPFFDGYAVVAVSGENGMKCGLIDTKGKYVIQPVYSGITYLKQGFYAVSNATEPYFMDYYSLKALYNVKGEKLTDYKFSHINEFTGDFAVASDNTNTFFIDKKGNIVESLPKLQGIGDITYVGNLLQAKLDGGLIYLKPTGEILWQKDKTTPLGNGISLKEVTYRRDYLTLVKYPQITGMTDLTSQNSINKKLKEDFAGNFDGSKKAADDDSFDDLYQEISIDFSVSLNKNLLIIEKSGYNYPIGAAHGMSSLEHIYIDMQTGVFYQLKDLFMPNSKYADKLTSIVKNQMSFEKRIGEISGEYMYFEDAAVKVSEDHCFIIGNDSITLYYNPYEIASYAAGFPRFEIPYGQISNIINTKGAFWNSFNKSIVNHKTKLISDIGGSTVQGIESLIGSYGKNIITAINDNSFSNVEPQLLKGSNLYNSQKKLVANLYRKNTKEKLVKLEIYAIDKVYDTELYRVYVLEEVAVKYSGKSYVNNKYSWCYTVKPDKDSKYKLCDIVKW